MHQVAAGELRPFSHLTDEVRAGRRARYRNDLEEGDGRGIQAELLESKRTPDGEEEQRITGLRRDARSGQVSGIARNAARGRHSRQEVVERAITAPLATCPICSSSRLPNIERRQ